MFEVLGKKVFIGRVGMIVYPEATVLAREMIERANRLLEVSFKRIEEESPVTITAEEVVASGKVTRRQVAGLLRVAAMILEET